MITELTPRAMELARCAQTLLTSGGYNSFSYADISKIVGISKASIHHHFPSKAELVKTALILYREEARAGLATIEAAINDPLQQLQAYIGYWISCIHDNSSPFCICAMLASELPILPETISEEVQGHFRDLEAWIARVFIRGVSQGKLILQDNAEKEAMSFVATIHGAMLSARAYQNPEIFDVISKAHLDRLTLS